MNHFFKLVKNSDNLPGKQQIEQVERETKIPRMTLQPTEQPVGQKASGHTNTDL